MSTQNRLFGGREGIISNPKRCSYNFTVFLRCLDIFIQLIPSAPSMAYNDFMTDLDLLKNNVDAFWSADADLWDGVGGQYTHYTSILKGQPENIKPSSNTYEPPMHRNPRSTINRSPRMKKLLKIAAELAPRYVKFCPRSHGSLEPNFSVRFFNP